MSLAAAKPVLIQEIEALLEVESQATDNPQASRKRLAQKLADAFEKFIKAGTVTTTGSATTQTGTIT